MRWMPRHTHVTVFAVCEAEEDWVAFFEVRGAVGSRAEDVAGAFVAEDAGVDAAHVNDVGVADSCGYYADQEFMFAGLPREDFLIAPVRVGVGDDGGCADGVFVFGGHFVRIGGR